MSLKIIPTPPMIASMQELAASGAKRIEIAEALGISRVTFGRLVIGDEFPEVKAAYLAGKQAYAAELAEDIMEQAAAPLHDDPKLANAEVQRRKLIVDTSKWVASKLLPKVYGDNLKINHEHTGEVVLSPLAQLRQLESKGPVVAVDVVDATPPPSPDGEVSEDDCF